MKGLKKFLAITLMVMTVLASMVVPTFAADTYTLTVDGAVAGDTFEAYQVFSGEVKSASQLANIQWGTGVNSANLVNALKNATGALAGKFTDENTATAAGVASVISTLNAAEMDALNKIIVNNLTTTKASATADASGVAKFTGLAGGYYFVQETTDVTGTQDAISKYIIKVVGDVSVTSKESVPEVTKKIKDNENGVTQTGNNETVYDKDTWNDIADSVIGEARDYKLEGTLPANYADYKTYYYEFVDTFSTGIDVDINTVKVSVGEGGRDITSAFNVTYDAATRTMSVRCDNLKAVNGLTANDKIVVTYKAALNADCIIYSEDTPEGNENVVKLKFSTNPNQDNGGAPGETPEDKVVVFTYELDLLKTDGATRYKLANVEFKLLNADRTKAAVVENDKFVRWDTVENGTVLKTGTRGTFVVKGLDEGTYYVRETKAPVGYNPIDDIKVVIDIIVDGERVGADRNEYWEGAVVKSIVVTVTDADGNEYVYADGDVEDGIVKINVYNYNDSTLPITGGMGTTMYYLLGATIMAAVAVIYAMRKRAAAR